MEKFLDEYSITDSTTRAIAISLNSYREKSRSKYSQLITRMSTVVGMKKDLSDALVILASGKFPQLSKLASQDYEKFLSSWRDAVLLMKAKWGTAH